MRPARPRARQHSQRRVRHWRRRPRPPYRRRTLSLRRAMRLRRTLTRLVSLRRRRPMPTHSARRRRRRRRRLPTRLARRLRTPTHSAARRWTWSNNENVCVPVVEHSVAGGTALSDWSGGDGARGPRGGRGAGRPRFLVRRIRQARAGADAKSLATLHLATLHIATLHPHRHPHRQPQLVARRRALRMARFHLNQAGADEA